MTLLEAFVVVFFPSKDVTEWGKPTIREFPDNRIFFRMRSLCAWVFSISNNYFFFCMSPIPALIQNSIWNLKQMIVFHYLNGTCWHVPSSSLCVLHVICGTRNRYILFCSDVPVPILEFRCPTVFLTVLWQNLTFSLDLTSPVRW